MTGHWRSIAAVNRGRPAGSAATRTPPIGGEPIGGSRGRRPGGLVQGTHERPRARPRRRRSPAVPRRDRARRARAAGVRARRRGGGRARRAAGDPRGTARRRRPRSADARARRPADRRRAAPRRDRHARRAALRVHRRRARLPGGGGRGEVCDTIAAVARGETVLAPEAQAGLAAEVRLRAAPAGPSLSPREREVLAMVAQGDSAPDIAATLHLSAATIKGHLQSLYEKLGVSDRAAAVAEAMRRGLLE